jgi:D-tyrosyl-tRNA(Tyr) deacylase
MKKGNKPDFHQSASGVKAKTLYQTFFKKVQDLYTPDKVKDGVFAAMMDVALINDGPVGIDYTCLDGEVLLIILTLLPAPHVVHTLLTAYSGHYSDRYRPSKDGGPYLTRRKRIRESEWKYRLNCRGCKRPCQQDD